MVPVLTTVIATSCYGQLDMTSVGWDGSSKLDCGFIDITTNSPRSNTPASTRKFDPSQNNVLTVPKTNIPRNNSIENFPEFPKPVEYDASSSYIDDSASIATSIEDEGNFDFEIAASDDPFPDVAEEAIAFDENIINDRIYKSIMAKVGNLMIATAEGVHVIGNIASGSTVINGGIESVQLSYKMSIARQDANDLLKKIALNSKPMEFIPAKNVTFELSAPAETTISFLNINVTGIVASLDDEIVSHLAPFTFDDQVNDNKLRLTVNMRDSNIEIVDRKRKKPMKLKITRLVIEQDEG
ncbi:unnamed protein product [Caenorhabditis bovis]|uniref:Uncharacterized protein n=1 Tax=Caenorhabditis bovis TaxID=2654633 RepID=A0A8S1EHW6_9PELO|nr:unnamed protein product [Caenorhabditis bovis]